ELLFEKILERKENAAPIDGFLRQDMERGGACRIPLALAPAGKRAPANVARQDKDSGNTIARGNTKDWSGHCCMSASSARSVISSSVPWTDARPAPFHWPRSPRHIAGRPCDRRTRSPRPGDP